MIKDEYCYINYEREFINSCEDIYKIGRTSQEGDKRLKQYSKGTIQKIKIHVSDSIACEKSIFNEFKIKFKQRIDIGREYFEGDINEMIKLFITITDKYKIIKKIETNKKFIEKDESPICDENVLLYRPINIMNELYDIINDAVLIYNTLFEENVIIDHYCEENIKYFWNVIFKKIKEKNIKEYERLTKILKEIEKKIEYDKLQEIICDSIIRELLTFVIKSGELSKYPYSKYNIEWFYNSHDSYGEELCVDDTEIESSKKEFINKYDYIVNKISNDTTNCDKLYKNTDAFIDLFNVINIKYWEKITNKLLYHRKFGDIKNIPISDIFRLEIIKSLLNNKNNSYTLLTKNIINAITNDMKKKLDFTIIKEPIGYTGYIKFHSVDNENTCSLISNISDMYNIGYKENLEGWIDKNINLEYHIFDYKYMILGLFNTNICCLYSCESDDFISSDKNCEFTKYTIDEYINKYEKKYNIKDDEYKSILKHNYIEHKNKYDCDFSYPLIEGDIIKAIVESNNIIKENIYMLHTDYINIMKIKNKIPNLFKLIQLLEYNQHYIRIKKSYYSHSHEEYSHEEYSHEEYSHEDVYVLDMIEKKKKSLIIYNNGNIHTIQLRQSLMDERLKKIINYKEYNNVIKNIIGCDYVLFKKICESILIKSKNIIFSEEYPVKTEYLFFDFIRWILFKIGYNYMYYEKGNYGYIKKCVKYGKCLIIIDHNITNVDLNINKINKLIKYEDINIMIRNYDNIKNKFPILHNKTFDELKKYNVDISSMDDIEDFFEGQIHMFFNWLICKDLYII